MSKDQYFSPPRQQIAPQTARQPAPHQSASIANYDLGTNRNNEGNASSRESRESNNRKNSQVINSAYSKMINGKPFSASSKNIPNTQAYSEQIKALTTLNTLGLNGRLKKAMNSGVGSLSKQQSIIQKNKKAVNYQSTFNKSVK